jgi:hypothetical protein
LGANLGGPFVSHGRPLLKRPQSISCAVSLLDTVLRKEATGDEVNRQCRYTARNRLNSRFDCRSGLSWPFFNPAQGELRCEGPGAVVIKVAGKDYGLAAARYPPIQRIWNSATYPEADTDRIIVRGLTLCDW